MPAVGAVGLHLSPPLDAAEVEHMHIRTRQHHYFFVHVDPLEAYRAFRAFWDALGSGLDAIRQFCLHLLPPAETAIEASHHNAHWSCKDQNKDGVYSWLEHNLWYQDHLEQAVLELVEREHATDSDPEGEDQEGREHGSPVEELEAKHRCF